MPGIRETFRQRRALADSRAHWDSHDWSDGGEKWSKAWGGTGQLWWGVIHPRLHAYLPAGTVLEIAPGFGRCSHYLAMLSERLVLVDIAPTCIEACRERFDAYDHIEYHVNDGKSLSMVGAGTVDLVFSFDSLVHAPRDVVEAYIKQLPRILRQEGVAFLHHSNLDEYTSSDPDVPSNDAIHGRATSVSAELVRRYAASVGMSCVAQEIFPWGKDERYSDCFSLLTRSGSSIDREHVELRNADFMQEARKLAELARLYGTDEADLVD